MKYLILIAMAICAQPSLGLALTQFDGNSDKQEGPSMPGGNGSEWAYQVCRGRRGPTGSCPDPNPRPDKQPQGITLVMGSEPNGPNRHPDKNDDGPRKTRRVANESEGPQGMSSEYYKSLTNDHYAGPAGPS